MTTGVVALSFAKRSEKDEPGPVNIRLAKIVAAINDELQQGGEPTILVTQWEIARYLDAHDEPTDFIVDQDDASIKPGGKKYLDSGDVLRVAFAVFSHHKVTDVIVVANPFVHLWMVRGKVRAAGFTIMKTRVPWVGFDRSSQNLQWWTKGPIRLLVYTAIQVVGKLTNHTFNGIGERQSPPN